MMRTIRTIAIAAVLGVTAACSSDSTEPGTTTNPPPGPAPVASVSVEAGANNVTVGGNVTFTATAKDAAGKALSGRQITWSSSAPAVATVNGAGVVTGVSAGTATISAAAEGKTGQANIVVLPPVQANPVATVTIGAALDTVEAWEPVTLQAILKNEAGETLTGRAIRWTSSNPAVATIDAETGVLTGVDRGTVTVTATSEGKSGTATRVVVIKYRSVAAGTMHACDIASGGIVWCWGLNDKQGRIGSPALADESHSTTPVQVPQTGPTSTRMAKISTFATHTCALSTAGKAYCWGNNGWGQLGVPTISQSYTPVAVEGNLTFKEISAGAEHTCALTTDGRAYCWGHNDWRQFGANTPAMSTAPVAVLPEQRFSAIQAGSNFTCGTTTDGATFCWGGSGLGQLGDGSKISYGNTFSVTPLRVAGGQSFTTIDAGANYNCALNTIGQAYCWGANGGRLGNGATIESSTPTAVLGGQTFRAISAGFAHTCAVATDAGVWCWGANGNGQVGNTNQNGNTQPQRVNGIAAAEVSASGIGTGSGSHSCAISADRLTAWCWGRNDYGQLGNGARTAAATVNATPVIVSGQKPLP